LLASPIVALLTVPAMEYRSRTILLGLPIVHVATARVVDGQLRRGIARGWIAAGDVSFGILISVGGVAFGGLSLGGLSVGVISLGGASLGALLALGGLAIGYLALGGAALAVKGAVGGLAVALDYAVGGRAIANHANDAAAQHFFQEDLLMSSAQALADHSPWLLILLAVPVLAALHRRRSREEQGPRH
jgi:hypothetical protein